jgi:hypothetical protein
VTGEAASHDQTSIPAVAPTTFIGFSRLPRELKDEIHRWVLLDTVSEDGAVEIMDTEEQPSGRGSSPTRVSLWAFTKAFEPLQDPAEFVAAFATLKKFLRRHTEFKATCTYLDSSEAHAVWSRYIALEGLLSPSPPFRDSFYLAIKGCRQGQSNFMLESAVWLFWEAMKQWHQQTGKRPGMMPLRRIELPRTDATVASLDPRNVKLQVVLGKMQNIPGLPASREELLAIFNKFRRMVELSELSTREQISLKIAAANAWLMRSR